MPLQPCRECSHRISASANVCPVCGVPWPFRGRASKSGRLAKGFLALFLVVGAVGAGIGARFYEEYRNSGPIEPIRPAEQPTTFPRLSVQLARSDSRLLVTNVGDQPWTRCMVDINAGVRGGGFSREVGEVEAGQEVAFRLDSFVRTDGRAFTPEADRVQVVDVHCETPTGAAHFTGHL